MRRFIAHAGAGVPYPVPTRAPIDQSGFSAGPVSCAVPRRSTRGRDRSTPISMPVPSRAPTASVVVHECGTVSTAATEHTAAFGVPSSRPIAKPVPGDRRPADLCRASGSSVRTGQGLPGRSGFRQSGNGAVRCPIPPRVPARGRRTRGARRIARRRVQNAGHRVPRTASRSPEAA